VVHGYILKVNHMLNLTFLGRMLAVTALFILASCLLAQTPPNADRWKNADPAVVVADPDFYRLSIEERRSLLKSIDRKFGQMSVDRQEDYMWKLETSNLPKPAPPKQVFTWAPNAPGASAAGPAKSLVGADLKVEATLFREDFFRAQLRITNLNTAPAEIRPRTFVLNAVKPKPAVLCYEYADRAALEMIKADARRGEGSPASMPMQSGATGRNITSSGGLESLQAKNGRRDGPGESVQDRAQRALTEYLPEGPLAPRAMIDGNVYFQRHKNAEEFVLRVYVGEFAFDFPMTVPKR
jgi:hypothetical protein